MADVNLTIEIEARNAQVALKGLDSQMVKVTRTSGKAAKSTDDLADSIDDVGKNSKTSKKETDSFFKGIPGPAAAAAVAIAGISAGLFKAIDAASGLQDMETQFIAFTGSAASAAKQVERIAEFSGQTPFQLSELAEANRTLLAFGSSAEESFVQLKQLGEAAAATGKPIGELSNIFGQVQAAGKLTGERFLQLAERGINVGPAIAKSMGVAESSVRDLISQGKVTADEFNKAFASMTEDGGQFAGSMERLSLTFSGATSTLSDNVNLLAADIGKQLLPSMVDLTVAATDGVKWLRGFTEYTDADRIKEFGGQIRQAEKEVENLSQQLAAAQNAANNDSWLFKVFAGDPAEEAAKLTAELAKTQAKIVELTEARDKLAAPPEEKAAIEKQEKEDKEVAAKAERAAEFDSSAEEERKSKIEKTEFEIAAIRAEYRELEKAIAEETREEENAILEEARANLLLAEEEKNIALLELNNNYIQAKKAQEEKARKDAEKARADEFNVFKQTEAAKSKFETDTWKQRAATTKEGLGAIAALQSTGNKQAFEIGKAGAIAQVLVDTPAAAMGAYRSLAGIPYVGPGLGAAAAAAVIATGASQISKINSAKFTGYAEGGLVEGGIPGKDSVPALLTPGEVVVPEKNFKDIGMDSGEQVALLTNIRDALNILISQNDDDTGTAQTINVELTLDRQVLANQILELNQDNVRIA